MNEYMLLDFSYVNSKNEKNHDISQLNFEKNKCDEKISVIEKWKNECVNYDFIIKLLTMKKIDINDIEYDVQKIIKQTSLSNPDMTINMLKDFNNLIDMEIKKYQKLLDDSKLSDMGEVIYSSTFPYTYKHLDVYKISISKSNEVEQLFNKIKKITPIYDSFGLITMFNHLYFMILCDLYPQDFTYFKFMYIDKKPMSLPRKKILTISAYDSVIVELIE